MTRSNVRYLTKEQQPKLLFSVCTLVVSDDNYERLLRSFEEKGFVAENTEFVALDNRGQNRFDGYSAWRRILPDLRGKYVVFVHDDVELVDSGAAELISVLEQLEGHDPLWAIAGCSGWSKDGKVLLRYLEDPHGETRNLDQPRLAQSLDECFVIVPRARVVFPSLDLSGFHMFASDMCLQAHMAGGHAYVVPFFLKHHSAGSPSAEYEECRQAFRQKYETVSRIGTRLRSPAGTVYFGALGKAHKIFDDVSQHLRSKSKGIARRAHELTKKSTAGVGGG